MSTLLDIVSQNKVQVRLFSHFSSFLLVRHPHVMEKLRTEVSSECSSNPNLSRSDLKRLPYLQNVLKESKLSQSSDG